MDEIINVFVLRDEDRPEGREDGAEVRVDGAKGRVEVPEGRIVGAGGRFPSLGSAQRPLEYDYEYYYYDELVPVHRYNNFFKNNEMDG